MNYGVQIQIIKSTLTSALCVPINTSFLYLYYYTKGTITLYTLIDKCKFYNRSIEIHKEKLYIMVCAMVFKILKLCWWLIHDKQRKTIVFTKSKIITCYEIRFTYLRLNSKKTDCNLLYAKRIYLCLSCQFASE